MQGPGSPEQWEHTSKLQNAHFRNVCAPPHPHPWHARPYLPSANHLLGRIDGLAAPRTALGAPDLLGKLGRVGVGGGPVAGGPAQGRACGEGMYRERHGVGGTGLEGTTRLHLAQPAPRPPLPGLQGHLPDGGHSEDPRVTSADGTHQRPTVILPQDVRLPSAPVRMPESLTARLLRTGLCPQLLQRYY